MIGETFRLSSWMNMNDPNMMNTYCTVIVTEIEFSGSEGIPTDCDAKEDRYDIAGI